MEIKTFNEYKVIYDGDKIIDKKLTERKTVRINQRTADVNNSISKSTGLYYELGEEEKPKAGRPKKDE